MPNANETPQGLEQRVRRLQMDNEDLRFALARLEASNARKQAEVADYAAAMNRVYGSTTWRLTAPLRRVVSRLSTVRGWAGRLTRWSWIVVALPYADDAFDLFAQLWWLGGDLAGA